MGAQGSNQRGKWMASGGLIMVNVNWNYTSTGIPEKLMVIHTASKFSASGNKTL